MSIGLERVLSPRWAVRVDGEFARGDYEPRQWESYGLALADAPAFTRSYALSATALRTWSLFGADRHQLRAGIGLLGRLLQMRGLTEMTVHGGVAPYPGGFLGGTLDHTERDYVNLAPQFAYRLALGPRWRAEATLRYELGVRAVFGVREESRLYQTALLYNPERDRITGASYGHHEFIDGPRATTYALRVSYGL